MDRASPSLARAQPALGQAWSLDYRIRDGLIFFNLGSFNLWA